MEDSTGDSRQTGGFVTTIQQATSGPHNDRRAPKARRQRLTSNRRISIALAVFCLGLAHSQAHAGGCEPPDGKPLLSPSLDQQYPNQRSSFKPDDGFFMDFGHCYLGGPAGEGPETCNGPLETCRFPRAAVFCSELKSGETITYPLDCVNPEKFSWVPATPPLIHAEADCVPDTSPAPCGSLPGNCAGHLGCLALTSGDPICVDESDPRPEVCAEGGGGDGIDDDCDGDANDGDCPDPFEIPCNGKDDNNNGQKDENGPQTGCKQCPFTGKPVSMLTRQMFVTPRSVAEIAIPISDSHGLRFEVGYDSLMAEADDNDDVLGFAGSQEPNARVLGAGVRSNWDHRLIIDNPTEPHVITWLHGNGSVRFTRTNTPGEFQAEPGSHALISRPTGATWKVLTDSGDILTFEEGSFGSALYPWDGTTWHARLRTYHPKGLVGYRFKLGYEDDASQPVGACDQITPGVTACDAYRGLLTRIAIEWIEVSGTVRAGPSMEFKYIAGGLTNRGEYLLKSILAGSLRAEGKTTSQLPVLARFHYNVVANKGSQLLRVEDGRQGALPLSAHFEFGWEPAVENRWQLLTVSEPVLDVAGVERYSPVESFEWKDGLVNGHKSEGIVVSTNTIPGRTMDWTRNGVTERSTFNAAGEILDCGSDACGVGQRQYAASKRYGQFAHAGLSYVRTEEGLDAFRFYDDLDRLTVLCEVAPSVAASPADCILTVSAAEEAEVITVGGGTIRKLTRTYYLGNTGIVRASAEWNNSGLDTTAVFPLETSTYVNWFESGATPLTTCPVLTPWRGSVNGSQIHNYRVSVYDYNSDDDLVLNETAGNDGSLQGDYALTRTTTVGGVNGVDDGGAGICNVVGVDRHGRPDRGITAGGFAAAERRFHLDENGAWQLVEDVYRGYKALNTLPRRAGVPSSFGRYKVLGDTSTANLILDWRECGLSNTLYDEAGRLICFEVPSSTKFLRVTEVPSTGLKGRIKRLWRFENELASVLLSIFRTETGGGRVLEAGVVGGNSQAYRYATTDAAAGAQIARLTERLSDDSTFSQVDYTYTTNGFLAASTTSGPGITTSERRYTDYDEDGRPGTITDENGIYDRVTELRYTAFDALESITEPSDGGGNKVFTYEGGRLRQIDRVNSPAQVRQIDRQGRLDAVLNGTSTVRALQVIRDGLGRIIKENVRDSAGVVKDYTYSDLHHRRLEMWTPRNATTPARALRHLYDGLGREAETCDVTNDVLSTGCAQPLHTYVYDTKGPFVGAVCAKGDYGTGITLTDNYMAGRLGYVADTDGATAYEYDALGRVLAVARYDGPMAGFNTKNVTCVAYAYNGTGALSLMKYPSSLTVAYTYGTDSQRAQGVAIGATPVVRSAKYESNGQVREFARGAAGAFGDWQRTVVRDSLLQVGILSDSSSLGLTFSAGYSYGAAGDPASETINASMYSSTTSFNGSLGRLIRNDDAYLVYDTNGRLARIAADNSQNLGYDVQNSEQVVGSNGLQQIQYDPLGQMTVITIWPGTFLGDGISLTLGHGLFGELRTFTDSTGTWNYGYDHQMRRVRKTPPTAAVGYQWTFRYGLGREVLEDSRRKSTTSDVDRLEWIYLAGEPAAVMVSKDGSRYLYQVHTDRMGVPRFLSTTAYPTSTLSGAPAVDAWGVGKDGSLRTGIRYRGQYYDEESGFINNGYRSRIGPYFTSPDPLQLQTQLTHLGPAAYTYAANRPQMYDDPDGRLAGVDDLVVLAAAASVYGSGAEVSFGALAAWGSVLGLGGACAITGLCDSLGGPTNGEAEDGVTEDPDDRPVPYPWNRGPPKPPAPPDDDDICRPRENGPCESNFDRCLEQPRIEGGSKGMTNCSDCLDLCRQLGHWPQYSRGGYICQ